MNPTFQFGYKGFNITGRETDVVFTKYIKVLGHTYYVAIVKCYMTHRYYISTQRVTTPRRLKNGTFAAGQLFCSFEKALEHYKLSAMQEEIKKLRNDFELTFYSLENLRVHAKLTPSKFPLNPRGGFPYEITLMPQHMMAVNSVIV